MVDNDGSIVCYHNFLEKSTNYLTQSIRGLVVRKDTRFLKLGNHLPTSVYRSSQQMRKETDVCHEIQQARIVIQHLAITINDVAHCHKEIEAHAQRNNEPTQQIIN